MKSYAQQAEGELAARYLPDLHAPNEAILDDVGVLHDLVRNDGPCAIADDLMDVDHDSPCIVGGETEGFDMRVYLAPLTGPVVANGLATVNVSALHPVRPLNVVMHGSQGRIDVAGIERLVRAAEKLLFGCHSAVPFSL
jgi:hypothetical protein